MTTPVETLYEKKPEVPCVEEREREKREREREGERERE